MTDARCSAATGYGPCVVCGDTNYAMSCGGPTICPKCDCGHFDAATVMQQAKVIADLRKQLNGVAQTVQVTPIYQVMETSDDVEGGAKDLWMDVTKEVFDDLKQRHDIRYRILHPAALAAQPPAAPGPCACLRPGGDPLGNCAECDPPHSSSADSGDLHKCPLCHKAMKWRECVWFCETCDLVEEV